jgi:DNA-binding NtrC family response regulator
MQRIFRLVTKVAPTDSSILLLGESGTGKELIARSIHLQSRRAGGPFVAVNVGALPESLMESELFGFVRGAFTGAASDREGLIESADGGTLFLDEIGDMPLSTQVKLLRTLESNELRRLGDNSLRVVDVRVIAATHRDLLAEAEAGRFRHDLYYRLNVVQIELPPLRERREDIGLLASYFLERGARKVGRAPLRFAPEVEVLLERYDWPGNVRELENAVEHAVTVAEGQVIRAADLPAAVRSPRLLPRVGAASAEGAAGGSRGPWSEPRPASGAPPTGAVTSGSAGVGTEALKAAHPGHGPDRASGFGTGPVPDAPATESRDGWSLAQVEEQHIRRVLSRHRGNATAAARQLGISRTTLWRKLRDYGIRRADL